MESPMQSLILPAPGEATHPARLDALPARLISWQKSAEVCRERYTGG